MDTAAHIEKTKYHMMLGEYEMQTLTIQLPSAALAYEKFGDGAVNLVIEMGLGASMAEWRQLAEQLARDSAVLLYQRAGYGASSTSTLERTPEKLPGNCTSFCSGLVMIAPLPSWPTLRAGCMPGSLRKCTQSWWTN